MSLKFAETGESLQATDREDANESYLLALGEVEAADDRHWQKYEDEILQNIETSVCTERGHQL